MKRIDPYLILLVLFSLFALGPLLGPGYFWGAHDGRHSVYFLFEFDRAIQDGVWYPRWAPDFTFGYGYPFFNIYGPGAFYLGEAIHLLGMDFVTATKIVFGLAIVLSGPAMFGFVKRLTGSSQAAFLSGLAYVYIPYHIADIYVRAALAESFALIFLPLTLWGFYECVVNPRAITLVAAALAYGAMLFTHNGIALLFTPVLGIWVLFLMLGEVRKGKRTLNAFIRLGLPPLGALLLGLGLVGIFVLPLALEYSAVRVDQWTANYYDYTNHFVYPFQLFSPQWGFGISGPGPKDGMSFQLGVVPVVLALVSTLVIVRNPNGIRRFWIFFAAMTLVVAVLMFAASLPVWEALRLVTFAQFPWRLLTLTTLSLSILVGVVALDAEPNGQVKGRLALAPILLGGLILLGSYPYLTAQTQPEAKEGPVSIIGLMKFQQSAGEMTGSTAWVKEIPTWSPLADNYLAGKKVKSKIDYTAFEVDNPDDLWIGVDQTGKGLRADGERVFIASQVDDLAVTFNTFYYPGWRAYLTPEQGDQIVKELPITPVGELGRIQVRVPQGRYWLVLRFQDTLPRTAGQALSGLSVLAVMALVIWEIRLGRRTRALPPA